MRASHFQLFVLCVLLLAPACKKAEETPTSRPTRRTSEDSKPVVVTAKVDKPKCQIGDKITYTVTVAYDPSYELDLPSVPEQFANTLLQNLDSWHDVKDEGTKKRKEIALTLDPGIGPVVEIPPTVIKFKKRGAGGDWRTATTEAITVEVASVADHPGEFREPLDSFELPPAPKKAAADDSRVLYWVVAAVFVLSAVISFVIMRKKLTAVVHVLAPHEVAQRELAHLASLGLLAKGEMKEFYFRLTMILRRYIESRFGIMAPERTTEEFLVDMKSSRVLEDAHKKTLADFLTSADMVKYARHMPLASEGENALRIAEQFVMTTLAMAPAPVAAPQTPERAKEVGGAV